jgi:Tol biopolymer transport system component
MTLVAGGAHAAVATATWPGGDGDLVAHAPDGVYEIDPDTGDVTARGRLGLYAPLLSPDARRHLLSDGSTLFHTAVDGKARRDIFRGGRDADLDGSWAPSGRRVVFANGSAEYRSAPRRLYSIGIDGRDRRRLVRSRIYPGRPVWPPKSRLVAFAEEGIRVGNKSRIAAVRPDGTGFRTLVWVGHGNAIRPELDFSPNGGRLLFLQEGEEYIAIKTVHLRSGRIGTVRRLGVARTDEDVISNAVWAPSGNRIAYLVSWPPLSPPEVRTVRPDGSGDRRLAQLPASEYELLWRHRR